jgi:hypothetical protein
MTELDRMRRRTECDDVQKVKETEKKDFRDVVQAEWLGFALHGADA